jgi:phage RecT family recombinase
MNTSPMQMVVAGLTDERMQRSFKDVLPANVTVDRFTKVTLTAIQASPEVLEADRQSLYQACVHAAARGLLPDKKEGALVVFNTKQPDGSWSKRVQFLPMPEGIIKEMAKAGVSAYAVSVYEKDELEIWNDDDGQHVRHKPVIFGDRGARLGTFAAGKTKEGRSYVEAMNMDDIARVRSRSKQKDKEGNPTGAWKTDTERMEQKSALHRLRKRIPMVGYEFNDEEDSDVDLTPASVVVDVPVADATVTAAPPGRKRPRALQAVVENGTRVVEPVKVADDTPPPPTDEYEGDVI